MPRVFIDGQAGTTGLEISQYLVNRPDIELLRIDETLRKDNDRRRALMASADVTILCLPDAAAREAVSLAPENTRLLDASTAHRTDPAWVYGLPELEAGRRTAIAEAARVANPGCYPQGFLLLVRPLVEAGLLEPSSPLNVFGLSGYSGGGRQMVERYQSLTAEDAERFNTRLYALGLEHKHRPEMQHFAGLTRPPLFVPAVANYYRGMLIQVPLHQVQLTRPLAGPDIAELLAERYREEPFIRVASFMPLCATDEGYLNATAANHTNRMDLMVFGNEDQFLLVARYDNLGKGAAGAAVQNLNLMLGVDEQLGLAA